MACKPVQKADTRKDIGNNAALTYGLPKRNKEFERIDNLKIFIGRIMDPSLRDKPESYWFNRTIKWGTFSLRILEQMAIQHPIMFGIPINFVYKLFS